MFVTKMCFCTCPRYQGDFFFAGGVEILEDLLRSAPKTVFSSAGAHTVTVLERIFQACRSHRLSVYIQQALSRLAQDAYRPQDGVCSLEHQITSCLLADFSVWAGAPPEFQFGLVTTVLDMIRDAPELFKQALPLQPVLASIRVCCPDQKSVEAGQLLEDERDVISGLLNSETTSESSADVSEMTSSTDQDWTRMAPREISHMRGFLWELVRLLLGRGVSKQDGDALVQFVASCDDTGLVRPHLSEVLVLSYYCSAFGIRKLRASYKETLPHSVDLHARLTHSGV